MTETNPVLAPPVVTFVQQVQIRAPGKSVTKTAMATIGRLQVIPRVGEWVQLFFWSAQVIEVKHNFGSWGHRVFVTCEPITVTEAGASVYADSSFALDDPCE